MSSLSSAVLKVANSAYLPRETRQDPRVRTLLQELQAQLQMIQDAEDLPLLIGEITHPVAQKYLEQKIKEANDARS